VTAWPRFLHLMGSEQVDCFFLLVAASPLPGCKGSRTSTASTALLTRQADKRYTIRAGRCDAVGSPLLRTKIPDPARTMPNMVTMPINFGLACTGTHTLACLLSTVHAKARRRCA
jgi:hypothetical protein